MAHPEAVWTLIAHKSNYMSNYQIKPVAHIFTYVSKNELKPITL